MERGGKTNSSSRKRGVVSGWVHCRSQVLSKGRMSACEKDLGRKKGFLSGSGKKG